MILDETHLIGMDEASEQAAAPEATAPPQPGTGLGRPERERQLRKRMASAYLR